MITPAAKKEMRTLLHAAERGASGKRPQGRCLEAVQNYLDAVKYGHGKPVWVGVAVAVALALFMAGAVLLGRLTMRLVPKR